MIKQMKLFMVPTKQNRFKLSCVVLLMLISVNITSAAVLEPPLKVAWKTSIGTWFKEPYPTSIDLIESDVVYVNYQNLQAIDANDGKLLWSKDWSAGVAYKDGVLYAARAFSPSLYALNATTGEEIWRKEYPELEEVIRRGNAIRYNLVISNDTLLIVTTGYYLSDVPAFDASGNPTGHYDFDVLAVDTRGDLKWHQNLTGDRNFESNSAVISDLFVIPYRTSSTDYRDFKKNLIALNLTTGKTVWERSYNYFEGNPYPYRDTLFIDRLRENDSFYIQAVSGATGETIWKRKVGDSYGNILAVKDDKLFVNSENIKVLNPDTGETLDEYSSTLDPTSSGTGSGIPGSLSYNPSAISDNIIYVVSTGPSPHIYAIDLNTGDLLWKGGRGGISPYIYKNRLFLIVSGNLFAYEYGIEEPDKEPAPLFFAMLAIPLILANLFMRIKKYSGRLQRSFEFSTVLIIFVFILILVSETLSNQYIHLMEDERLISSSPADWRLYLLFPAISVITGTIAGMRIDNRFMISAVAGAAPYILAISASFLFLSITDKIYFFFAIVPVYLSIQGIILIGIFYGVVGIVIGLFFKLLKSFKKEKT